VNRGSGGVPLSRKCLRDRLGVSASEIAQCDSIKGYSLKSKKILGTKAGTYESLKSQPLVSACFITGIKSKLAEKVEPKPLFYVVLCHPISLYKHNKNNSL
jgi:hypothetical protein